MIKVLSAEFKRPYSQDDASVLWQFTATTDTNMPHGYPCFGGELTKNPDGLWQARIHRGEWGPAAFSGRLAAIQIITESVIAKFQEVNDERATQDRERARRIEIVTRLRQGLPTGVDLFVRTETATPVFEITVKDLTEKGAEKWINLIKSL